MDGKKEFETGFEQAKTFFLWEQETQPFAVDEAVRTSTPPNCSKKYERNRRKIAPPLLSRRNPVAFDTVHVHAPASVM